MENGLDAWRRLYYHYMPLAGDLQQLLIQELYSLTPVSESGIDGLFNQVERITELYTRHGNTENHMSEKCIKAAVMRNLPEHVTNDLAIQLKYAKSTGEVRHIVNTHIYIYTYIYIYIYIWRKLEDGCASLCASGRAFCVCASLSLSRSAHHPPLLAQGFPWPLLRDAIASMTSS